MQSSVWITGQAQLSSMGLTVEEFSAALAHPQSNAQSIEINLSGFDPFVVPIYAANFDSQSIKAPSKLPLDRSSALALGAVDQLIKNTHLNLDELDKSRVGIFWGSGMSGASSLDSATKALYADKRRIRPTSVITSMPNAPAAEISLLLGVHGPCLTYATACASSAVAIGEAMLAIASGRVDLAIVGGSESMLSPGVLASWDALRVIANMKNGAKDACRPFDEQRTGFALGEGAAAFVIESSAHAQKHGRSPLAILSGYATNCDGVHMTNPSPAGQREAMLGALRYANLKPKDISYINAHGTATSAGDLAEAQSITEVFGEKQVPVSSTKSMHGHLLGGGGAVELLVALDALSEERAPHTVNLTNPDPKMQIDLIQGEPRVLIKPRHVMSNSFAFGGTNAVLIASKP
jgi:3-oxoacyl-[acyl-carrier-protein] synthase II